jgi:4-hydroxy-tetrahydrodipicolinate reductase
VKLGLIGHGRMGLEIEQVAEQRGHAVAAVFEVDRPFRRDAELAGAEVLIDFSLADGVPATLRSAAARAVPIVEGTTGWYQHLPELSALPGLTMIYSPNFSIGVYRFTRLVEAAARLFGPDGDYDCYVHEWHHRGKADSPSGTARNLAEVVLQATPHKERLQGEACHRPIEPDELHVTSTRAGRIPGPMRRDLTRRSIR